MHVWQSRYLLAIVGLLWCACTFALNPDLTIKQLHHTAWGPSQGAPLGGAVALAQTSDGYLWIAGPSGLFRFDGIVFERVALPDDPKLSSLTLYTAFAPRGGGLWVGFTFGGVALLKEGHWQVYSVTDGVPPGSPHQFAETPDGTLWVATNTDLARFDGVRWKAVGAAMGVPASGGHATVFVDGQGAIWTSAGNALFVLRPGEGQFHSQSVAAATPWSGGAMAESPAGTVWLDLGTQLVPVAQNPPPVLAGRPAVGGPAFDHDGTLWESMNGLRRLRHPEHPKIGAVISDQDLPDAFTDTDGLTSRTAFALLVDREGNVWVGTSQGLDRFSEPSLEAPLQSAENLKVFSQIVVTGVVPADDAGAGGLWVTNDLDAVVRYQDGRMSAPILRQQVGSLLRAADGTVWFGGRKALWRERGGHLESLTPPGPDRDMQALALDKSGGLWVSVVRSGVFRLQDGVWTPFGGIATLPHDTAIAIVRDRRGRLWFSYPGGSVAVLDDDRVHIYGAPDGLQIGNVMAIHQGRSVHWLGGEFGLARLDGARFSRVRSVPELPLDGITGIIETTDGDLWLNGRPGIVHIAATELERGRRDPAYRVHGETLGAFDGVVGSGAVVRPLPTAIEAGDGKLWFATSSGIYGIDPARRVHNRIPPPVSIRALTVAGRAIDPIPGLALPFDTTAVRFDYAGLSLTAAEKVRYRYRLEGVDTDWHEVTAARQALYTNLRPGHYTFRVIAANNDGVWNDSGTSLAFAIPPTFVQTGWFIALCVAGSALALWALVRLRVRQAATRVRGRLEERMAERERIARELHDTLLQGVHGLLLRFQVVADRIPKGEPAREMMDRALERADQVLDEGRERVKALRAPVDGTPRLPQAMAHIVEQLAPADASPFRITVEGAVRELNPIVSEEVQLLAREALTNAYRHANAGKIESEISYGDDGLTVRIRDDGQGIDGRMLREGRPGHFGILGMRERAKRIRAHLRIWSRPGAGTEVELRIPARIAYRQAARRWWRLWWRKAPALDIEDAAL